MSGFVAFGNSFVPIASIQRLSSRRQGDGTTTYHVSLRDQDELQRAWASDWEQVLVTPTQLIPAQDGTYVVWAWLDEGVPAIIKRPVIAWALCLDSVTRPVTPQGVNDGISDPNACIYIEMPNGSVQAGDAYEEPRSYDNVEAYRVGRGEVMLALGIDRA